MKIAWCPRYLFRGGIRALPIPSLTFGANVKPLYPCRALMSWHRNHRQSPDKAQTLRPQGIEGCKGSWPEDGPTCLIGRLLRA
ncbi:hypothetical protein IG631_01524 [Alternaria alternata]|nr:hypothetical protein IG631_01524 [Alternaria alternata]